MEENFTIHKVITFAGSKGNYRKVISKTYKANRTQPKPKLWAELKEIVIDQYSMKSAYGMETDDLVATYWKRLSKELGRDNVLIVSLDKDYKQLPALIYNYHHKHQCLYDISKEAAMFNFYASMITGDTSDNINTCKGYGIKYAEKLLKDCKTKYQYTKKVFSLYKKIYKQKARQRYVECYNLLGLAIWEDYEMK